jgi:hypothetical protein
VLAGTETFVDIARFGEKKIDLLGRFRPFIHGTPAHDHLGDILIACIAHTQPPPANATDQQTLQQTEALSGRSGKDFAVGSVGRQAAAVGEELVPDDIPRLAIRNDDAPLILRHPARLWRFRMMPDRD